MKVRIAQRLQFSTRGHCLLRWSRNVFLAAGVLILGCRRLAIFFSSLRRNSQHGTAQSLNCLFPRKTAFLNFAIRRDFVGISIAAVQLLVAENLAEGFVHFQPAIVADVSQLPKFIHEVIDSRAGRADHISKNLMIGIGDFFYGRALSIQVG